MPGPIKAIQATVLRRSPVGERFLAFDLLSPVEGNLRALQRRSSRQRHPAVDLFDGGSFQIELPNEGPSGFLKEASIERKRPAIALRYANLQAASLFARFLLANPLPPEHAASACQILDKGLEAWEQTRAPEGVLLKCLFCICRDEGYPVKALWLNQLGQGDREDAVRILNEPSKSLADCEEAAARLRDGILAFMRDEAHFRLP